MSSPTIDFKAICNALAARFVAAAIGTPTGATAIRQSFAQSPKNVSALPAHLLEVSDGTIIPNPGQWRHEMGIDGVLLLAKRPADPERVETLRQLWLPYLLHATMDKLALGLSGQAGYSVDKAVPSSWEWIEYEVGGVGYDAIRVRWTVYVTETVSLTL